LSRPIELAGEVSASAEEVSTRRRLIAISTLGMIATITGVSLFSYPITFEALRRGLVVVHDASGDLLLGGGVLYLFAHLRRTWRMKRLKVSRYTGFVAVASWIIAGSTGIYGQLFPMVSRSTISWIHAIASLALIVLACFHGAWGFFRRTGRPRER
jgi:hypothetical protein